MRYESADDVRLRLHRSVVAHNGKPVVVEDVLGINEVVITYLDSGDHANVRVDSLDLDPSHLPLGYVFSEGKLFVASRKPCRKYKQGLTNENFHYREVMGKVEFGGRAPRMGRDLSHVSKAVVKTMMGQFPDVGTAFQSVRKGSAKMLPFSREWAVGDDGDLCVLYRGEVVGYVTDTAVRLLPERAYLKESLELCLN